MRNYIINGEGQLRIPGNASSLAVLAQAGMNPGLDAPDLGYGDPDVKTISNITHAVPTGILPGWGHGPGGGAVSSFQILDRDFHDHRWANSPERLMWFGWSVMPNPAPFSQGSGWEPGAVNADGTSRHDASGESDWRITFLEGTIKRCEELLGRWVGYSFQVLGGGGDFPVRPLIMSGYKNNDFYLHDLTTEVVATQGVVRECCGWFQIPDPPSGKIMSRSEFGLLFGIDTLHKTPQPIVLTGFKLVRYPGAGIPDIAPHEIKNSTEKEPMSMVRARASHYTVE